MNITECEDVYSSIFQNRSGVLGEVCFEIILAHYIQLSKLSIAL